MWNNFEHQVWQKIKNNGLDQKELLLAVSGGLDSMVLFDVFCHLNLQKNIKVLHFHHGDFENKIYRDEVKHLIEKKCQIEEILCIIEKSDAELKSEAQFRDARKKFFAQHKTANSVFVTAHHLDDVLETRLIKMIRGTGVDGLLAFQQYNTEIFRPFLDFSKNEILDYALSKKIKWIDDPTNAESGYLRNWIRNEWLPALNKKHQGGVHQLAHSLDRLIKQDDDLVLNIQFQTDQILLQRMWFFSLSTKDQLKVLSKCVSYFQKTEFTTGNLQEINKRLDKNQKEYKFELLCINWVINAQQIMVVSKGNNFRT